MAPNDRVQCKPNGTERPNQDTCVAGGCCYDPVQFPSCFTSAAPARPASSAPEACASGQGAASFSVGRNNLRFGDGAPPHVFDTDVVAHAAYVKEPRGQRLDARWLLHCLVPCAT